MVTFSKLYWGQFSANFFSFHSTGTKEGVWDSVFTQNIRIWMVKGYGRKGCVLHYQKGTKIFQIMVIYNDAVSLYIPIYLVGKKVGVKKVDKKFSR